jgi:hypothetical protein
VDVHHEVRAVVVDVMPGAPSPPLNCRNTDVNFLRYVLGTKRIRPAATTRQLPPLLAAVVLPLAGIAVAVVCDVVARRRARPLRVRVRLSNRRRR